MSLQIGHVSLATADLKGTQQFLEYAFRFQPMALPGNSPLKGCWYEVGPSQSLHFLHSPDFRVSPFEDEFARHIALIWPSDDFDDLIDRLRSAGADVTNPARPTDFERVFAREPVDGYLYELVRARA